MQTNTQQGGGGEGHPDGLQPYKAELHPSKPDESARTLFRPKAAVRTHTHALTHAYMLRLTSDHAKPSPLWLGESCCSLCNGCRGSPPLSAAGEP